MSSTGSCDGFLTLNQSILVVVISGAVVMMAFIVIAIVSVQYHKLATRSKKASKQNNQPRPDFYTNNQALLMTSSQAPNNNQLGYDEIFRRKSLIPRPQVESANSFFAPMPQQTFKRSQSLPVTQPQNPQPKANPGPKKIVDQSTTPIRKVVDKPRDEAMRPTKNTNKQNAPQQQQKAASGMKIPMQPQRKIPADIPEEPMDLNYAEQEWIQDQMQHYKQDKVAKKSHWEATPISDNFILQSPDQARMMSERYG